MNIDVQSAAELSVISFAFGGSAGPWYSSGLHVALVFVGGPLAVTGLIWLTVVALDRRHSGRPRNIPVLLASAAPLAVPTGVSATDRPCWIVPDQRGREVHEDIAVAGDGGWQSDLPCWTAVCVECGQPYREGGEAVHFPGPGRAAATIRAHGWDLTGGRTRCVACGS